MLIGIDASRYNTEYKTGVEKYSEEIINGLVRYAEKQVKHELILYTPREIKFTPKVPAKASVRQKVIKLPRLWTQVRLSWEMSTHPSDVLFVPSHTLPFIHPKRSVIMIHDVAFYFFKEAYHRFQYHYLDFSTKFAVKHAEKIITPSQATKNDLIAFYHCDPAKVEVIPHGYAEFEQKITEKEEKEILEKFGLNKGENYFFFVGRLEEKKNLFRLIEAFQIFSQGFSDWKLILGGKSGVGFSKIWKIIRENKLTNKVFMPGYLTETEREVLLSNAKAFTFPSLYEGFGFPLLDAFSGGIPVLTSSTSALKEVAGNAAYLVNPLKIEEMAQGLRAIATDHVLRAFLISKGKERVKVFNWEEAVKRTWEVLAG